MVKEPEASNLSVLFQRFPLVFIKRITIIHLVWVTKIYYRGDETMEETKDEPIEETIGETWRYNTGEY